MVEAILAQLAAGSTDLTHSQEAVSVVDTLASVEASEDIPVEALLVVDTLASVAEPIRTTNPASIAMQQLSNL
jgi:hypothetical protein